MSSTPSAAPPTRRVAVALAAALAVALGPLALAAPAAADSASPTTSASTRPKSTFIIGSGQDIDSLNPYVGVVAVSYDAYQLMYDTLTESSATDMSPVAGLAESWEPSADGNTWTFHIRRGVKWSDGKDLTAKDVVYTFNRALTGETENGQYGSYLTNVTKVSNPDDYTVVITTSVPSPSMLTMAVPILPEHVWSGISAGDVGTFANTDHPVGSGPFQLTEARKGQFYRFAANKNYWRGAPKIDELVIQFFADGETMVQALKKGDIDFAAGLSTSAFASLKDAPGVVRHAGVSTYTYELGFNIGAATTDNKPIGDGHPALKDKRVRLAIDYALDKQTIVDKVLEGQATIATGEIPPIYPKFHWEPAPGEARGYDKAKAAALLDEAGYKLGTDGVRAGPDGKKLKLRLFGRENSAESKKEVEYIRDWLTEIGIQIEVAIMSEDALTDVIGKGEYDMFQWDWAVEPDPDFQLSVFTCDQRSTEEGGEISAGWSDSFYCDPGYEALYAQQKTILDVDKRAEVVKQAQKWLYDNAVYAVLYYPKAFEAYRSDRFTGFIEQPTGGGTLSQQFGTWSYRAIEPVTAPPGTSAGGSNTALILGLVAGGVVLVVLVGVVAMMRRRSGADTRE